MAEMKSKKSVVGHANACVKVYTEFANAIKILKDSELVKSFDGKYVTKRHTDKMQTLLPKHISVELRGEDYQPYLNLKLYYNESVKPDADIRNYLDYYGRAQEIRQQKADYYNKEDMVYCVNGLREFHYDKFVLCAEKQIKLLEEWAKQYQDVVDRIDEAIEKQNALKKHIDEVLATFPSYIKPYVSFSTTLYDDSKR